MKAILFSAGFGTRLKPWTDTTAKPALNFLGLPMMAYPLYYLLPHVDQLIINTHHLPETIHRAYEKLNITSTPCEFIQESPKILDSGGTIKSLESKLKTDPCFITANADSPLIAKDTQFLKDMLEYHKRNKALATLLTTELDGIGTKISAAWTDKDHHIKDFGKDRARELQAEHYAGFMILSPDIFNYLPEGQSNILLHGLLPAIAKNELVISYYRPDIKWFETGTVKDFDTNQQLYKDEPVLKKINIFYTKK